MQSMATTWDDEQYAEDTIVGRMTSESGYKVCIIKTSFMDSSPDEYRVEVNGKLMADDKTHNQALVVARWWMDGCPV